MPKKELDPDELKASWEAERTGNDSSWKRLWVKRLVEDIERYRARRCTGWFDELDADHERDLGRRRDP